MGLRQRLVAALTAVFCLFQPAVSSGHPCSALRKLENGQAFFRYGGLFATFSCRHGYRLYGHRTNSCVSGRWTRDPPICVGSGCLRPDPVARGSFRVNNDASWVEFSCDRGYKLLGPSRLYCKGNEWSSSQPLCEEPDLMHSPEADDTTPEGVQSQSQTIPQSPMSSKSTITQTYATMASVNPTFGPTSLSQPIPPSEIKLTNAPTEPPPELTLSTTLHDQPQNVKSSKTEAEMNNDMTTPNDFQPKQRVHQLPTRSTSTSPLANTYETIPSSRTVSPLENDIYSSMQTNSTAKSGINRTSNLSCPHLPAPEHGTLFYRNKESLASGETVHSFQYVCDPGFTLANGDAVRYCQEGATWSGVAPECQDVDECALPIAVNRCLFGCVNSPGSYYCLCPPGYTLLSPDHALCQDIDECEINGGLGPCSGQCHNTPGSFHCSCSYGFTLAGDGLTCIPECPKGYRKQPLSPNNSTLPPAARCVDVNECEVEGWCEWKCINLPGTYRCICPRRHIHTRDGRGCRDIDECSRNNGGCSHICINLKGSYKCACPPSHRFSPHSWKACVPRL